MDPNAGAAGVDLNVRVRLSPDGFLGSHGCVMHGVCRVCGRRIIVAILSDATRAMRGSQALCVVMADGGGGGKVSIFNGACEGTWLSPKDWQDAAV